MRESLSAYSPFPRETHRWSPLKRVRDALCCFHRWRAGQALEQTVELSVIWYARTFMWSRCSDKITMCYVQTMYQYDNCYNAVCWRDKQRNPNTGLLCGEFTGHRWISHTMASFDVFFHLRLGKQWRHRWFETPSRSLWRHCNGVWFFLSRSAFNSLLGKGAVFDRLISIGPQGAGKLICAYYKDWRMDAQGGILSDLKARGVGAA